MNLSYRLKKNLIFLGVTLAGIGIFVFWLATFDFSGMSLGNKFPKSQANFRKALEENKIWQQKAQIFSEIKRELIPPEDKIIKEKEEGKVQKKKGVIVTLATIVFKEQETWIYLNIKNNNDSRVLLRSGSRSKIKIIQGSKEFSEKAAQKILDYPLKDIIEKNEEIMGVLHFPALDPASPLILFMGGVVLEGEEEHFNFLFQVEP